MTLPELMCKIWDGDENEFFTWLDMNRVEYNANALAAELGIATTEFVETTRASQFRYDEAQKLEDLLASIAAKLGIAIPLEESWGYNRAISYVDFERWESGFWTLYTAMGGIGERIPAGKVLVTYSATLFASDWRGAGPYYQDLTLPAVMMSTDAVAYLPHIATIEQRMQEYDASLTVRHVSDRKVRVYTLQALPTEDLPIRISLEGLPMHEIISLTKDGWTGSGPWTQTVTLSGTPANAVIGPHDGMTDAAVLAMADAIISVSAISGSSVTVRAVGTKPTIDLDPAIMWEASETV